MRTVCKVVPQEKEVTVNVCRYESQQQEGTRTIFVPLTENVTRKVQFCKMVPYQDTIRVLVCAPPICCCCSARCCSFRSRNALVRPVR